MGGSVLRRPEDFVKAARNIKSWVEQGVIPIVVVSAMKGVTDRLISASSGAFEELCFVEQRYMEVADELGSRSLASRVGQEVRRVKGILEACDAEDYVVSLGERLSRIAMVQAIEAEGVRAFEVSSADVIVTDGTPGNATIIYDLTAPKIRRVRDLAMKLGAIPVIDGFAGADVNGFVTTLGRGCSDYTATTIASLLGINAYLVTDVAGVMTADPDVIPSARTVSALSYGEAREAAFFGVKGLNPKALDPLTRFYPSDVIVGTWNSLGTVITRIGKRGPKLLCNNSSAIAVIGHGANSPEFALEVLRLLREKKGIVGMEFSRSRPLLKLSIDATGDVERIFRDLHEILFAGVSES